MPGRDAYSDDVRQGDICFWLPLPGIINFCQLVSLGRLKRRSLNTNATVCFVMPGLDGKSRLDDESKKFVKMCRDA